MDMTDSLRIFAADDRQSLASHCNAPSGRPDGAAGKAVTLGSGLAPPEDNVQAPGPISQPYPPAFDRDTMRWMPLVIPLLGFFTVVLTGLMWMVVG